MVTCGRPHVKIIAPSWWVTLLVYLLYYYTVSHSNVISYFPRFTDGFSTPPSIPCRLTITLPYGPVCTVARSWDGRVEEPWRWRSFSRKLDQLRGDSESFRFRVLPRIVKVRRVKGLMCVYQWRLGGSKQLDFRNLKGFLRWQGRPNDRR